MEQSKKISRKVISILLSLLMVFSCFSGLSLTAWATPEETLLTTITPTGSTTYDQTVEDVVTVTLDGQTYENFIAPYWTWGGANTSGYVKVEATDGYTITKCEFSDSYSTFVDTEAPFEMNKYPGSEYFAESTAQEFSAISSIKVYGYATASSAYADYLPTADDDATALAAKVVKFGGYDWYLIEDNSTSKTEGTVTLFAKDSVGKSKFNNSRDDGNLYSTSKVKAFLDELTAENGIFADVADAIRTVTVTTNEFDSSETYDTATDVKLYLLSASEADALPQEVRYTGNYWWLRSPGNDSTKAACVYNQSGTVNFKGSGVNYEDDIRPALKLDLSKVEFDSETNTFAEASSANEMKIIQTDVQNYSDYGLVYYLLWSEDVYPCFSFMLPINETTKDIENGKTYTLEEMNSYYCIMVKNSDDEYVDFSQAEFTKTVNAEGLVNIDATVVTQEDETYHLTYALDSVADKDYPADAPTEWYVGDIFNLDGFWCYFTDVSQRYVFHCTDSEITVPAATYESEDNDFKFADIIKYDLYDDDNGYRSAYGSTAPLYITKPDDKDESVLPVGFKIKSGNGHRDNPFSFELIYPTPYYSYLPKATDDADALAAKVVKFNGMDWYLIEDNATSATEGTVTLFAKECVGASQFDSNETSNTYSGSTLESYVNSYYADNFSAAAQEAVSGGLFILTTEQANTIKNANADVLKCNQPTGANANYWWLCSPGSFDNEVACVLGDDGDVSNIAYAVYYTLGVRPALKLDLSKVTFDSETNTFSTGVDKSALNTAITEAETLYDSIKENTDYTDIANTLKTAIDTAKAVADNEEAEQDAVDTATTDITNAKAAAEAAKKDIDDTKAANAVIDEINNLPEADAITTADKDDIESARKAYDELTDDQKAKVPADVLTTLTDAETALAAAEQKEADDTAAAQSVTDLINALPAAENVTTEDEEAIEAARAAYDALTDDQKAKVDSDVLQKLTDAEDALAAAEVEEAINALPAAEDVTVDDEEAIEAAREAYDALTDDQKAYVSDEALDKLEAAEDALNALLKDGWVQDGDDWYFYKKGEMQTGWVKSPYSGKWFYMDKETGIMQTGWILDEGNWYYLKPGNGDMATGWILSPGSGKWFYLKKNGAMATGWIKDNGNWYYLKPVNGDMATGWVLYKDNWYYLNDNGAMATGWVLYKNDWYYLNSNGDMRTADLTYKGKVYHFNSSGACTNP